MNIHILNQICEVKVMLLQLSLQLVDSLDLTWVVFLKLRNTLNGEASAIQKIPVL